MRIVFIDLDVKIFPRCVHDAWADQRCMYFPNRYDPTIESTHHKTIRFRKVHFATDIVDTAGMVSFERLSLEIRHATMIVLFSQGFVFRESPHPWISRHSSRTSSLDFLGMRLWEFTAMP